MNSGYVVLLNEKVINFLETSGARRHIYLVLQATRSQRLQSLEPRQHILLSHGKVA